MLSRLEAGLAWSFERLPALTAESITDPAVSERVSAIVDRFTKLQDQFAGAMRHAHGMLGEKSRSFADVVTWAVGQEVIPDSKTWLELRSMCNRLTHEYDLERDSLTELIGLVREAFYLLVEISARFKALCQAQGLV